MDKAAAANAPELMKEALVAVFIKRMLERKNFKGVTKESLHK